MAGRHVNDLLLNETTGKLSAELTPAGGKQTVEEDLSIVETTFRHQGLIQ